MVLTQRCIRLGSRVGPTALASWFCVQVSSALLVTACSSSTPIPRGGASVDATYVDGVASDADEKGSEASASDAIVSDDAGSEASITDSAPIPDGDTRCGCASVDAGFPPVPLIGVLSLSCYCEMPWAGFTPKLPCVTYDEAVACRAPFEQPFTILTYTNCDLVTVGMYGGLVIDERHYDAKTHEFVGARRGVDHSVSCGSEMVMAIQAGILPGPECQIAGPIDPCRDGGAGDAAR